MSIYGDVRIGARKAVIAALLPDYPTVEVIFSHSNGAEPPASYVVVNILSTDQIGKHITSSLTNTVEELSISAFYEILVRYSFCGSLSGELAQTFNHMIGNNPLVTDELNRNNLGYMRKSQIRRVPQKRDTEWVEYQNIDVTFNYTVNTQQLIDVVEGVVLEDNLSDPPLIIKIPDTITYP